MTEFEYHKQCVEILSRIEFLKNEIKILLEVAEFQIKGKDEIIQTTTKEITDSIVCSYNQKIKEWQQKFILLKEEYEKQSKTT